MRLDEIQTGVRLRRDLGNIKGLAASILRVGLLHPPVVTPDGRLVAGYRRLEAVKLLGWQEVPVTIVANLTEALPLLIAERDENCERKSLLSSEAVALANRLEPKLREEARERQRRGGRTKLPQSLGKHEGEAERKVAAAVGLSAPTLAKARELVEAAEREPERFRPLLEQMDRTGRVSGVHRRFRNMVTAREIEKEAPPLPVGPFRVIVADPPWAYTRRADDPSHRGANPYPTMTSDEIEELDVESLAHDDSILWLWTTNAFMNEAHRIAASWGFEVKTILTWAKDRMGTGDWLRGQTEHCLMAGRGKPTILLTTQTTLLSAPPREHSRKPDEFYALVESLCPGSKVELFARGAPRDGWAVWGAEAKEPDRDAAR